MSELRICRYHPEDAPRGQFFTYDQAAVLPEGWVDTEERFPGGRLAGVPMAPLVIPPSNPAPKPDPETSTTQPNPVREAVIFAAVDFVNRASDDQGDAEAKLVRAVRELQGLYGESEPQEEPSNAPLPGDYDALDQFMEDFIEFSGLSKDDFDGDENRRQGQIKMGVLQYAMTKFQLNLDRRMTVENLAKAVKDYEAEHAEKDVQE